MVSVLIVDDEPSLCDLIKEMVADQFDDFRIAENGAQGIAAYREKPVDLVITDLVMPGINGIDLILELKRDYPGSRIIAISGGEGITGRFEYLPIARLIGAAAVLDKPFTAQALRDAVDMVLAAKTARLTPLDRSIGSALQQSSGDSPGESQAAIN